VSAAASETVAKEIKKAKITFFMIRFLRLWRRRLLNPTWGQN